MDQLTFPKARLQEALSKNREAHRGIFEEAVKGYEEQALSLLQLHMDDIRAGRVKHVIVNLPYPEDHTRDYDRILAMLDMMIGDDVELDEGTFAQYVMDDWHWKRQFLTTNSAYSVQARASL